MIAYNEGHRWPKDHQSASLFIGDVAAICRRNVYHSSLHFQDALAVVLLGPIKNPDTAEVPLDPNSHSCPRRKWTLGLPVVPPREMLPSTSLSEGL